MDDTERLEQIETELIQTRLKQIDDHIAALEAKASEPATASEPAKAIETTKTQNDRTIHG